MVDATQLRTAKQEGRLSLLLRQMAHRFGEIPPRIATRMQALDAEVLDDLAIALFDFTSYADVEQWLARN